jgi:hypothetical protein
MSKGLRHGWLLAAILVALTVGTYSLGRIAVESSSGGAADSRSSASSYSADSRQAAGFSKAPDSDQLARRWYRRHWRWRYI